MYIAMNRFRVTKGSETAFEHVWLPRDTYLDQVPGFVEFHLLKGPEAEDHTLYASHTIWDNRSAFEAWTRSEAFRAAHHRAGDNKPLYLGHPQFEGFEVCQTVLMHRPAAIDIDGLAGHEVAGARSQEHHGADQVFGHLTARNRAAFNACGEVFRIRTGNLRLALGVAG
jgi:heme-degrading monooxygenase HmoA